MRKFAILGVGDSSVATFSAYRIAGNIGGVIWRFGPKPSVKNIGGI